MTVQLKELTEVGKGGMHVSLNPHGLPDREEVYFDFTAIWLGKAHQIAVTADRYRTSSWNGDKRAEDRLTDWRVIITRSAPGLTDAARRAAYEQIEPIVTAWIGSDDYWNARKLAYFQAIRRTVSEERYNSSWARRAYESNCAELAPEDAKRLVRSIDLLKQLLASLQDDATVPA